MPTKRYRRLRVKVPRPPKTDLPIIIFANLSDYEKAAFLSSHIPYQTSGPVSCQLAGPFISTYFNHLPWALSVLGWVEVQVDVTGGQWIVRRLKPWAETLLEKLKKLERL